jgi:hypothetical protein
MSTESIFDFIASRLPGVDLPGCGREQGSYPTRTEEGDRASITLLKVAGSERVVESSLQNSGNSCSALLR